MQLEFWTGRPVIQPRSRYREMLIMEDSGGDVREQVEAYQRVVLEYERLHKEIDALIMRYDGATENMPAEDIHHYRDLAERRDEAYNQMRVFEQNLLSDDDSLNP